MRTFSFLAALAAVSCSPYIDGGPDIVVTGAPMNPGTETICRQHGFVAGIEVVYVIGSVVPVAAGGELVCAKAERRNLAVAGKKIPLDYIVWVSATATDGSRLYNPADTCLAGILKEIQDAQ